MEDWISQRAFARRRGVSHTAVQKAIRDGRIPSEAVKREGDRIVAVEFKMASAAWDANTDPAAVAKNTIGLGLEAVEPSKPGDGVAGPDDELPLAVKDPHGYQLERAKREKFAAATAELEYLKAIGRVVEVDAVNEAQRSLFRNVRDKFLNLADRLTPVVTTERDPARVHAAIKADIEQVLNELSDDAREAAEGTAERMAA
jgi:hypothetical protein